MTEKREVGVGGVTQAVADLQIATDALDAAAGRRFGVNRTDLALLSLLDSRGTMSPAELADGLGLTRASTTVAVQRMVDAGLVTRTPNPDDGRRAVVALTSGALQLIREVFGPIGAEGARVLGRYSRDQLATILDFLARARKVQDKHAQRLRDLSP